MNVAVWLERAARLFPERPALFHGTRQIASYRTFHERVCRLAGGLNALHGIGPGDRVAVFMANDTEYLPLLFAIWQLGAVVVPTNYKLHSREAGFILENSGARVVFCDQARAADLRGGPHLPEACTCIVSSDGELEQLLAQGATEHVSSRLRDDIAWLFYTSGTTGRPKGVQITHGNLQAMTLTYFADVDEVYAEDVALYAAPMSHGAGIYNFMHILRGAGHCIPESGSFEPSEILNLAKSFGSVHLFAAPTMVHRLVAHAKAAGSTGEGLRTIVYAGGPMYLADIIEAVEVMGPRFVQVYGQGECPMSITALPRSMVADRSHPRWRDRLASVGTAVSCSEVMVLDTDLQPCAPGETGEIAVRGAAVMRGYWDNPEATARTIRGGWLLTGDVGHMDTDGFVTLTDRSRDVIISGGTNIYPREVEEVLLELDEVDEVSVIGRGHPEWGEEVVACIVFQAEASVSIEALDSHCLNSMARFKRPKAYHVLEALPKNAYGKVLKTELRKRFGGRNEKGA
ncbi:class I adenylate-forming enzyme family protein [Roseibium sp. RKSG952]|uniref:class I adenylate-forming enzyme family protein n=1 Tax=Roseibium sp. RKSG952 TaxID=2529384 RepID=UPI0012BC477A|nr:AMP-binding protein [Roseibium sp. RKSG952]MTH97939.1 long-chain fatty acid--CoA ligase [Roseibium sp. RKSG952]